MLVRRSTLAALLCLFAPAAPIMAKTSPTANLCAPDRPEPGSVEAIREFTTDPKYLPASVACVPESASVPSPSDKLGHIAGAPGELSDTATVIKYFRALDAASDRVEVRSIGTTEEGREIILAIIADAGTLKQIGRYMADTAALADPRTTSREEMETIVARAKPVYYLNGGLHSPETGSPEMLMELAYRLAVSDQPSIRRIREKTITLINPVSEPDGRDRVVQWYYRHLKGRTDYDIVDSPGLDGPPYWGHYIFHDNNRDGIQITAKLTEAVDRMYWEFHPTVIHDLHESLPLLYIMMGHGPYSEAIDPVTVAEWSQMAQHEVGALQSFGLPGVWTWGFWDGWWPGYLFSFGMNHNSIGRFYETFGNSSADTFTRKMKDIKFVGKEVTTKEWYRTWPPDKTLKWSLRNNTNYMQAGVLEALDYAALHGEQMLRAFWTKGYRAVERGRTETPYAWVFPEEQADRARLAYLINQLGRHHIEVSRAVKPFTIKEEKYAAGTYVVRMDQPYRNTAFNLLKTQEFPKDEPNTPYDDVAWTLPLLYGVQGARIDDKAILEVSVDRVTKPVAYPGDVEGDGPVYLLKDTGQEALLSARFRLKEVGVDAAEKSFKTGDTEYPAGSWIIDGGASGVRGKLSEVASELGLDFVSTASVPDVPRHPLDLPRLAVYHNWMSTQDAGWVRYTFDQGGFAYDYINDDDIKRGDLKSRFDVILMPDTIGNPRALIHGIDPKHGPIAYTKTDQYPSHGVPDGSPDITGGIGFAGMANLQKFLADGGLFIGLADAGLLPVEGGLVRDVNRFRGTALFTPGSELRAMFRRPDHPIAYGYDAKTSIFRGNGALFEVTEKDEGMIVLQFGTKKTVPYGTEEPKDAKPDEKPEPLCISGLVKSEDDLSTKPAILDIPAGKGRVVLFAFNPLHRFLNHSDFRLVYNVILNHNDLDRTADGEARP